ncbi:BnaC07g32620D [Brassica napus]|uniref:(rape) hypothetical protein n=1 Tax=Brassica napus TaxID=3708 RepID=A0A078GU76_BRANA|nr:unnamed protein product [Brassica napus]CDY29056.1 BnaC07g32620D [Brassica napus]
MFRCDVRNRRSDEKVDWYNILASVCKKAPLTSELKKGTTVMVYDPCSEYYMSAYLNSETVKKAIYVKPTNLPYAWQPCNHTITNSWSQDDIDLILVPLLHKILGQCV